MKSPVMSFINVKVIKFLFSSKSLVFILYFGLKSGFSIYVSPGRLLDGKIISREFITSQIVDAIL